MLCQVQSKLKQLQDQEKNVTANIDQYDNAIAAIKSNANQWPSGEFFTIRNNLCNLFWTGESNGDISFDAFSVRYLCIGYSINY